MMKANGKILLAVACGTTTRHEAVFEAEALMIGGLFAITKENDFSIFRSYRVHLNTQSGYKRVCDFATYKEASRAAHAAKRMFSVQTVETAEFFAIEHESEMRRCMYAAAFPAYTLTEEAS
jgi:hypothetical protein